MIRLLLESDLAQITRIEQSAHVAPWSNKIFQMCFTVGFLRYGFELDGKLVGFIIFSIAVQECHILNLAVLPTFQKRGCGRTLLEEALKIAKSKQCRLIYLEVRKTNERAIELYKKFLFQEIGVRKNYYVTDDSSEDALVLALDLSQQTG